MNWQDVTLGQYQQLYPILLEEDSTDLDKLVRMISVLTGKTEAEIDSQPLGYLNSFRFLFKMDFENKIPRYIYANGRKYKFVHEIQKMPAARYIETKTFLQDGGLIPNLHLIMASCVLPMRKTLLGWEVLKYDATRHGEYAKDMQAAPFVHTYNACLFFCQLFVNWIRASRTYLMRELAPLMTAEETKTFTELLPDILDGITAPSKLQSTNA